MKTLTSLQATKRSAAIYMGCFFALLLAMTILFRVAPVYAVGLDRGCTTTADCDRGLVCDIDESQGYRQVCKTQPVAPGTAVDSALGKVTPPKAIADLGMGAAGISNVLNNLVTLIYVVAGVIFLFMIVFGAVQWIISGGDKEKVSSARNRITHAIIGIFILALAFVAIRFIGEITGFEFFVGQSSQSTVQNNPTPTPAINPCLDGSGRPC